MTQTVHVGRMNVRYRVSRDDAEVRRRLDDLLDTVLVEGLGPALARAGVPADEEVCIRFVRAPARLRLEAGAAAAVAEWSAAIAEAIVTALTAPRRDIVRYRTRRAALVELALGIAARDYERCWAWRQLGLWHGSDPTDSVTAAAGLVRVLVAEPESVVAVLGEVARAGTLTRLAAAIDEDGWLALARAALVASGAPPSVLDAVDEPDRAGGADPADAVELRERARAIVAGSRLAVALAAVSRTRVDRSDTRAATAALAWLEAEPAATAATSAADSRALVAAIAAELASSEHEPLAELRADVDDVPAGSPEGRSEEEEKEDDHVSPTEPPLRYTTRFGGLLFLLGVLDELELPAALQADGALADRPLGWVLHRLALAIVPAQPDDPGALAFAGLAPESLPPEGDPPSDGERAAIGDVASTLAEHVRVRLERPDAPPDQLLDFVCRRRAEILFDPGWIELRLATEEISVEFRRAGLDLDPGWLPWLGAVVRFAYV
jgi:hypothetical protein